MERFQGIGDIGGEILEDTREFYIEISVIPLDFPFDSWEWCVKPPVLTGSLGANPAIRQLV